MVKKTICVLLFVLLITTVTFSYAASGLEGAKATLKKTMTPDTSGGEFNNTLGMIVRLIQYSGTGIAVIVVTVYGIKYMIASPQEKADVKKQMVPIVIGCALLFGAANLVKLIASMTGVLDSSGG